MADFCKQCSIEMFGKDFKELANLVPLGDFVPAICEGCGYTVVDTEGNCQGNCQKESHYNDETIPFFGNA